MVPTPPPALVGIKAVLLPLVGKGGAGAAAAAAAATLGVAGLAAGGDAGARLADGGGEVPFCSARACSGEAVEAASDAGDPGTGAAVPFSSAASSAAVEVEGEVDAAKGAGARLAAVVGAWSWPSEIWVRRFGGEEGEEDCARVVVERERVRVRRKRVRRG